jgi:hypothetical protein
VSWCLERFGPVPALIALFIGGAGSPHGGDQKRETEEQRTGDQRNDWIEPCDDDQADHHDDRDHRQEDDPDAKVTKASNGRTHVARKAEHAVDADTSFDLTHVPLTLRLYL